MEMDPLSDSFEVIYSPQIEPDNDTDTENIDTSPPVSTNSSKTIWSYENTMELIEKLRKDCPELWDSKHPGYKDKKLRVAKQEYLATTFKTTLDEIGRKLHNLKTQFRAEIRKSKKRRMGSGCEEQVWTSSWDYFESLSFLLTGSTDRGDDPDLFDPIDTSTDSSFSYQGGEVVNLAVSFIVLLCLIFHDHISS